MNESADCVIVGAGVVGLSIAYHLAARGMQRVVVLEKESQCGTGSTGRCAGGFRHQFSNEANIRLSLLAVDKLRSFEAEMDQPLDFHQDGYLFLLSDESDVEVFSKNVELQRRHGVPVELIDPDRIPELLPGTTLNLDDIRAATFCGTDGVSDPAGVTEGYRRNATRLGVSVRTDHTVEGVDVVGGRVRGVSVGGQRISTPWVVNAAGPHAAAIGKLAGISVPVVPLRRFIWTTHPFDGTPQRYTLVIDFKSGFYFHRESEGVLFGMGNRKEGPTFDLNVDWDFFDEVIEIGTARMPALANASIRASWAGSYETSPDANPILGRVPELDGLILANGFSGHGFQHAPGVGQLIAEEILDGCASTLDISSFSIERFCDGAAPAEYGVV